MPEWVTNILIGLAATIGVLAVLGAVLAVILAISEHRAR